MNSCVALSRGPADPGPLRSAEAELVRHAQAGRAEAREELARRHRREAYLLALQLVGNRDDALDVAQEALLRFFAALGRFERGRPVRPWLFAIVRNQVRDLWRRRRAHRTESLDDPGGEFARTLTDTRADPQAEAERRALRRRVWRAIAELDPEKREILVLRDFHDLAYAELAEVLGIPAGTVMSRLHAARKQLRERLAGGRSHG